MICVFTLLRFRTDFAFSQHTSYCVCQSFRTVPEVNCSLPKWMGQAKKINYFLTKLQLFPINSRQTDKSKSFQLILKAILFQGGFCGVLPGDAGVLWGRGGSPGRAHCTSLVIHPNDEKLPERKLMRRSCRNRGERESETEREKRTLKEITFRRKKRFFWTNQRFRGATGSPSYTRPRQWAHTNGCQANEKVKFIEGGSVEAEMEALYTERAIKRLQ